MTTWQKLIHTIFCIQYSTLGVAGGEWAVAMTVAGVEVAIVVVVVAVIMTTKVSSSWASAPISSIDTACKCKYIRTTVPHANQWRGTSFGL